MQREISISRLLAGGNKRCIQQFNGITNKKHTSQPPGLSTKVPSGSNYAVSSLSKLKYANVSVSSAAPSFCAIQANLTDLRTDSTPRLSSHFPRRRLDFDEVLVPLFVRTLQQETEP